jgi:hypothetical protein
LVHVSGPGKWQPASKGDIPKEDIGHSLAFGSWQPGYHQRIQYGELFGEDERPAGYEDKHQSHTPLAHALD